MFTLAVFTDSGVMYQTFTKGAFARFSLAPLSVLRSRSLHACASLRNSQPRHDPSHAQMIREEFTRQSHVIEGQKAGQLHFYSNIDWILGHVDALHRKAAPLKILDVGAGTGILSRALAKKYPKVRCFTRLHTRTHTQIIHTVARYVC